MSIGTVFIGGVKRFHKQQVQTKFLVLALPIAPIAGESLLVMEDAQSGSGRQGYPIKLNTQSVVAGYTRIPLVIGGLFTPVMAFGLESIALGVLAAILVPLAIYMIFFFGKTTAAEEKERLVIGALTGAFAQASWFHEPQARQFYNNTLERYTGPNKNIDWKEELRSGKFRKESIIYLFALSLLNDAIEQSADSKALREKATALYNENGQ